MFATVQRNAARHPCDGVFAGRITDRTRAWAMCRQRPVIDDPPPLRSLIAHLTEGELCRDEHASNVHIQYVVKVIQINFFDAG